jgi:ABC-type antimicrobial peptide transport system permease subunit
MSIMPVLLLLIELTAFGFGLLLGDWLDELLLLLLLLLLLFDPFLFLFVIKIFIKIELVIKLMKGQWKKRTRICENRREKN